MGMTVMWKPSKSPLDPIRTKTMIPSIITDTSITFIAQGRPWVMASDHPKFADIKTMLQSGNCDESAIIRLTDVRVAVEDATKGAAVLSEDGLFLNGEKMPKA